MRAQPPRGGECGARAPRRDRWGPARHASRAPATTRCPPAQAAGRGSWSRREHTAQQRECPGLVEELVEIAALGALDARGTAALAGTAGEKLCRVGDPPLELVEAARRDLDAARVSVVDEDRRRSGVEVEVRREAARCPSGRTSPREAGARSASAPRRGATRG